jgi:hypothetical protein
LRGIVERCNQFNTRLKTLAHTLNPRFYDEDLFAQTNGKRKGPYKDREVANGVKRALSKIFPTHLHREMKEEFVSFLLVWMIIQTYQLWMRGAP